MKRYESLAALIEAWEEVQAPGRIYLEENGPDRATARCWVVTSDEEKLLDFVETDGGRRIPEELFARGIRRSLLDTQTFKDVVEHALRRDPPPNLSEPRPFIDALDYYLENDVFMP